MGWSIVNVTLEGRRQIHGNDARIRKLVEQVLADGYEPYASASTAADELVMSFRKETANTAAFESVDVPRLRSSPEHS